MKLEDKIRALKVMVQSDGWREVLKPSIAEQIKRWEKEWLNGRSKVPDDVLKGRIWALVWLLDVEGRLEAMVRQFEEEDRVEKQTEHIEGGPY